MFNFILQSAMQSLIDEMERRVMLPSEELRLLPAIVCIVDEYISLINNISVKEKIAVTSALSSLLRRGRHAKIHILLATQEPSKESMQINLNNVNARIAFTCSNLYNSLSLLGEGGADKLPGNGTMLFKSPEHPKPLCLQGAFISTKDIEQLIIRITSTPHDLSNKFVILDLETSPSPTWETGALDKKTSRLENNNKEMVNIILWTLGRTDIAAYPIMQHFHMGNRAVGVLDELFKMNLIADKFANQPRVVLPQCVEDIPNEIMEFLSKNGVSVYDVAAAIQNRGREQ